MLAGARSAASARSDRALSAAGPRCVALHAAGADRRRDDAFATFRAFNRSLQWDCPAARPVDLPVAPNSSWPDVVYYNSFTHDGESTVRASDEVYI